MKNDRLKVIQILIFYLIFTVFLKSTFESIGSKQEYVVYYGWRQSKLKLFSTKLNFKRDTRC